MKTQPLRIRIILMLTLLCGLNQLVHAQVLTWNNGTGNGQWDTTSINWGQTGTTWNNATPDSAVFGATGIGVINIAAGITANSVTFNNPGYIITGGTLTLGGAQPGITNNAFATISSTLAGTSGLVKAGSGTLTLTAANNYTGGTVVALGTLQLGNTGGNGTANGAYNIYSGATLLMNRISGIAVNANYFGAGTLDLAGNTSSLDFGPAALPATFTGTITVALGRLDDGGTGNPAVLGDASRLNILNGGQFGAFNGGQWTNSITIAGIGSTIDNPQYGALRLEAGTWSGPITLSSNARIASHNQNGADTITGTITGNYQLELYSDNENTAGQQLDLIPSAQNTYGSTEITGTMVVNANNAFALSTGALIMNGGELNTMGNNFSFANISSTSAGGVIQNGGAATSTITVGTDNSNTSYGGSLANGSAVALGLTKTGTGILTITSTKNSYTGNTTINNGTLQVDGALPSGSGVTVTGSGILAGSGIVNGPVTVQSGGTLAAGGHSAVGTLTLANSLSSKSGSTVFLRINKTGGVLAADKINLAGTGSSMAYNGALVVTNITSDSTALAGGDIFTLFSSAAGFSGSFTSSNLPPLSAGLAWQTSGLTLNGSIQVVQSGVAAVPTFTPAPGSYLNAQTVTINSVTPGATIYYTTDGSTPTAASPSGITPVTVFVPANTNITIRAFAGMTGLTNSGITTGVYVTKSGRAAWLKASGGSWSVASNWTNSIIANGANDTADFGELTLNTNAFVTLDGAWTIDNMNFGDMGSNYNWEIDAGSGGPLTLVGTNSPTIQVNNETTTITAVISGVNGLTKSGLGNLTLTGANSYSGMTIVTNGTLQIGNGAINGTLGSGNYGVAGSADIYLDYATASPPIWANISGAGTLELNSAQAVDGSAYWGFPNLPSKFIGTLEVDNGRIDGTPTIFGGATNCVIAAGAQFLAFDGTGNGNTYTFHQNYSINGFGWGEGGQNYGAIRASGLHGIFAGNINLAGYAGLYTQIGQSSNATTITVSGVISGTNDLAINACAGRILLSGTNTYTGNTWVLAGVLQIGDGTNDGSITSSASIVDATALAFDVAGSETYSNSINDEGAGGSLKKIGGGTLILSGADSYSGTTTIGNGTLEVDGSLIGGSVTVNTNAILDGMGTIGGPVTINSGGTLAVSTAMGADAVVGMFSVYSNLTLNGSCTNFLRITKTGGAPASDVIRGVGAVNYSGTLAVTNITSDGSQISLGDSFALFSGFSSYTGSFNNLILPALPPGESWDLSQLNVNGMIRVSTRLSPPVFNPAPGNYIRSSGQPLSVTISAPLSGAIIYYTTDGTTPTSSSPSGVTPVTIVLPFNASITVQAYVHESGYTDSGIASSSYFNQPSAVWTSLSGGSWSVASHWTNNVILNANNVTADFSRLTLSTNAAVTLDGMWTVGNLVFGDLGNSYNWEIDNGSGGPLTLANVNPATVTVNNQTTTINANLAGTNGLVKAGNGTLIITSDNTYTGGTVVNNGTLLLTQSTGSSDNNSKIGPGLLTVNASGVVTVGVDNMLGVGTVGITPSVFVNGGTINAGNFDIQLINLTMNGGVLTGSTNSPFGWFSYGDITIETNPVSANIGGSQFIMRNPNHDTIFDVAAGGSGNDLTVSSPLAADGSGGGYLGLVKTGGGTLTLTATNIYSGATTVNGGLMLVNGLLNSSNVTVQAGAILGGSGTIQGETTVQAGGTVQGGNVCGSGTLAVAGLNLGNSGADVTYSSFKVAGGGNVAATTLNVNGINIINLLDSSLSAGTNTLFSYSGGGIGGSSGFAGFKLGALPVLPAGSSAMLQNAGSVVQLVVTSGANTNVPSLDEMAGGWLEMTNVANPPDVNNCNDMLLINWDLTSYFCNPGDVLYGGADGVWNAGYPLVTLSIAGNEYQATECCWYPYCALRRNTNCAGLEVLTDTRMIYEQRAVLENIKITNPSPVNTNTEFTLSVPGNLQADGVSVINTNQRPGYVTVICPATTPNTVTTSNGNVYWSWNLSLPADGTNEIGFVAGDGYVTNALQVSANVTGWSTNFYEQFDGFKQSWEQRWADAFTPGNSSFSGSLPVLVTDNAALKRNYYMGIVTMLELERTQFPVSPRSFITSGERAPGTQFYWDGSMGSTVWALLEPVGMKATLRRWLVQNPRSGLYILLTQTNGYDTNVYSSITGYAFNADTIFKTTLDYLRVTGDLGFLDEQLEDGETVLQRMDDMATDWETLTHPDSPLADYGGNDNLLECDPNYIGRVASCNAQDVWMMRQDAVIQELKGNAARAQELNAEAVELLAGVLSLYKSGDGVWYDLPDNGQRIEVRHCVDYIYVGDAFADEPALTSDMRAEMTDFANAELVMPDWMRAMSLKDPAAPVSNRPDHGPTGAYDGWPALTVGAMWQLGFPTNAFDFYCSTAGVTEEGPYAQAHEFYGPNWNQNDAPVRIAQTQGCMKECICGAAFADVVVNTFFGFSPSLDGKTILADPQTSRPFTGTLVNVCARGNKFTISAGTSGANATLPVTAPALTTSIVGGTGGAVVGGSISFSFPTMYGYNYYLDYSTNLTQAAWIPLLGPLPGNASIQTFNDSIGTGNRFYRLRMGQ